MNEKIKKLAADARGQMNVLTTVDEDQWEQSEEFVEKFAELIIQECANFVDSELENQDEMPYVDGDQIKEHFGVE